MTSNSKKYSHSISGKLATYLEEYLKALNHFREIKLIEPIQGWLKNWRTAIPLRPTEVAVSLP